MTFVQHLPRAAATNFPTRHGYTNTNTSLQPPRHQPAALARPPPHPPSRVGIAAQSPPNPHAVVVRSPPRPVRRRGRTASLLVEIAIATRQTFCTFLKRNCVTILVFRSVYFKSYASESSKWSLLRRELYMHSSLCPCLCISTYLQFAVLLLCSILPYLCLLWSFLRIAFVEVAMTTMCRINTFDMKRNKHYRITDNLSTDSRLWFRLLYRVQTSRVLAQRIR